MEELNNTADATEEVETHPVPVNNAEDERLTLLRALMADATITDAQLSLYLEFAKSAILNRIYPFSIPEEVTDVPRKYTMLCVRLAQRMYLRRGAEGEKANNENGFIRNYGSVNDEDLLMEVMQVVTK